MSGMGPPSLQWTSKPSSCIPPGISALSVASHWVTQGLGSCSLCPTPSTIPIVLHSGHHLFPEHPVFFHTPILLLLQFPWPEMLFPTSLPCLLSTQLKCPFLPATCPDGPRNWLLPLCDHMFFAFFTGSDIYLHIYVTVSTHLFSSCTWLASSGRCVRVCMCM